MQTPPPRAADSWWATAPREDFTAQAATRAPEMNSSIGAKLVAELQVNAIADRMEKTDRKIGGR